MKEKPGKYPFTRGIYPEMYKTRNWTMRQYSGMGSAEDSNKRYRYLLEQGVTGLSVAFDLPTQIGYDSDHNMSEGEVGRVGVPISSIEDMRQLFKEIPLDKVSTSMTINSTAPVLLAFYLVLAEENGIPFSSLQGTIQNDILKEYIARGTHIYPPEPSMRLVTDIFEFCSKNVPKWNTISISGYHIREAGSTAAQELAFTFANAIAYVSSALERGLDVDSFGKRLSFFFNAHNDFITEIAKFRAARRMWAKIMKDRFHAKDEKTLMCRFHAQTGGSTLAAQQIDNNIVRTTVQAMSAILGGTQSLHTNSKDEALALPTDETARLALRTQQILAHESGIPNFPDPFGGSYIVEELTDSLEKEAFAIIKEIDDMGGTITAIENGWIQNQIAGSAYEYQTQLDDKEIIQVGVNRFREEKKELPPLQTIDTAQTQKQIAQLAEFRKNRNGTLVTESLEKLRSAAGTDVNLMPFILDCARNSCTVGEISDILRSIFDVYHIPT